MPLRDVIESAFAGVQYPGDESLLDDCVCEEAQAVAQYFRGRPWQGHAVHSIRFLHALGWLGDSAFHYYLPAHLIAAADEPGEADALLQDLHLAFVPPRRHRGTSYDRFVRRISRLSLAQQAAVVRVFEHLRGLGYFTEEDVAAIVQTFSSHANAAS